MPCFSIMTSINRAIVFFMERDEANDMIRRYTVRAQRKVMTLMGQDVWVDVEDLPLYGL